ncbi:MAG: hypothetical protein E7449_06235 [Ruminococcaceae bacterium]|nr:hypothetical protein [Oscillospiraceae bacterium]
MKKRTYTRILILLLIVLLLAGGVHVRAAEPVPEIEYVPIYRNNQVVDSLHDIKAYYNLDGQSIQWCNYLIERYYNTTIGIEMHCSWQGPVILKNETGVKYYFEKLPEDAIPQTGDILFGPASLRGYGMEHWCMVKSYDQYTGRITIFEQNWRYNGQAGVGRQLDYPTKYYYLYRLMTPAGEAEFNLPEIHTIQTEAGHTAVDAASRLGIATVFENFQKTVTIEQLLLWCCNTIRAATGNSFYAETDAPLAAAEQLGLISPGTWQEGDTLTREVAAVILVRLAELLQPQPETDLSVLNRFTDACKISAKLRPAVAKAVSLGLMTHEEDRFDPSTGFTVEQALISLADLAQNVSREVVLTYVPVEDRSISSAPNSGSAHTDGASAACATASILGELRRK